MAAYLAGAPPDDEPLTGEDLAAAREALGDLAADRLVDLDDSPENSVERRAMAGR